MIKIEYNQTNYEELLRHIAKSLKLKVTDYTVSLSKEVGNGYIRELTLENNLQVLLYDYTPAQSILFQQKKGKKEFFTLRFDDVTSLSEPFQSKSSVFLGSTKFDLFHLAKTDFQVKSINVLFNPEWLDRFFNYDTAGDDIKKYISLNISSYIYETMDSEYKRLMNEVLDLKDDKRIEKLIIQNRIMIMMERFFTRLYKKMTDAHFDIKLSNDDILRLKMIETELTKDFSLPPLQINELAKKAAMSPSKLKASFKRIYGLPIYQYYQKHRMNKAKAMLLSRNYTVKEVASEVGFINISNFVKAFSKSFDQQPADFLPVNQLQDQA